MYKASKHKLTFVFSEECHGGVKQTGTQQDTKGQFLFVNYFHNMQTPGYIYSVAFPI